MTTKNPKAIANSYWVVPGRFLAGEYPGALEDVEARHKLIWLLDNRVTFFLNLTGEYEAGLRPYDRLLFEEAGRRGLEVVHTRMPIRDLSTPSPEGMSSILRVLDVALENGRTVYLHCYGGVGRTGLVVGCYLVRHGLSGKQALARIADLRRGTPDGWKRSPETSDQVEMMMAWNDLDGPGDFLVDNIPPVK